MSFCHAILNLWEKKWYFSSSPDEVRCVCEIVGDFVENIYFLHVWAHQKILNLITKASSHFHKAAFSLTHSHSSHHFTLASRWKICEIIIIVSRIYIPPPTYPCHQTLNIFKDFRVNETNKIYDICIHVRMMMMVEYVCMYLVLAYTVVVEIIITSFRCWNKMFIILLCVCLLIANSWKCFLEKLLSNF